MKKTKGDDDNIAIIPSGLALNIAAGWLGIKNVTAELENKEEQNDVISRSSKQFAGLGYVGSKRKTILSGVEHRLGKKVYGSFKNRVGDAIVETTSKGFQTQKETERRQKIAGNTKDDSKSRHETNRDDGSDDDEEGGRGTAFTAKKTQRQGGGLGRHDLLVQPARRKK